MNASHRRRRRGFTLMEVLLVMAILVILGSFATLAFQNVLGDSELKQAENQAKAFSTPVSTYWLHVRQYPTTLQALLEAPADIDETTAREMATSSEKVRAYTDGHEIVKVLFIPGRLVNIVVR